MSEIFDERYKEVVERVLNYDMDLHLKAVCLLKELDSMEDDDGTITYGTMIKAIFELIERDKTLGKAGV